jgi:hypothetical protein
MKKITNIKQLTNTQDFILLGMLEREIVKVDSNLRTKKRDRITKLKEKEYLKQLDLIKKAIYNGEGGPIKIIIELDGGLVQDVHTDFTGPVEVIVSDRDIIKNPCADLKEQAEREKEIKKCDRQIKNMRSIL